MAPFAGFLELGNKLSINLVMGMHMGDCGPGCRFPQDFHQDQFNSRLGTAFVWYLTELIALIAFTFWGRMPI